MSNVFGNCEDNDTFVTFDDTLFDSNGDRIVRFTSADGLQQVDVCLDPVKGATIAGAPVEVVNGILVLPEDIFGSGEVSTDGKLYTLTFPNQTPVTLCLDPVKSVVQGEDGDTVVTTQSGDQNTLVSSKAVTEGTSTTTTHPDGSEHTSCNDPVKTVTGNVVDNTDPVNPVVTAVQSVTGDSVDNADPANPEIASSSTEATPEGFHTITTADGVETPVCLAPVKSINGESPDSLGNVAFDQAVVDPDVLGNGDFASVRDAQGNEAIICLKPVKSINNVVPDAAGNVAITIPMDLSLSSVIVASTVDPDSGTTTYQFVAVMSDGTQIPFGPVMDLNTSGSVDIITDADFFIFRFPDGTVAQVCKNPVKSMTFMSGPEMLPDVNGNVSLDFEIKCETEDGDFEKAEWDELNNCFIIPFKELPETSYVYVPFDSTIHEAGPIEGDGTSAAPYQIPLPSKVTCSVELIKTPVPGNYGVGDVIEIVMTVINSGNVALTDLVVESEDVNLVITGGPIANLAAGATDSTTVTAQYTVITADVSAGAYACISTVTGLDPDGSSVISGDDVYVCLVAAVEEPVCELTAESSAASETINVCPSGASSGFFGIIATDVARGSSGYCPAGCSASDIGPDFDPNGWSIPIPAVSGDCVLGLQVIWATERGNAPGVNSLGTLVASLGAANTEVTSLLEVFRDEDINAAHSGAVFFVDTPTAGTSGADTIVLNLPDKTREVSSVVNYQWHLYCADDGQPLTSAMWNTASTSTHGYGLFLAVDNPVNHDVAATADCASLVWTFTRHGLTDQGAQIEQQQISDNPGLFGNLVTNALEITDTTSWLVESTGIPCQLGMSNALITAGDVGTFGAQTNLAVQQDGWVDIAFLFAGEFNCSRTVVACTGNESQPLTTSYSDLPCDGQLSKTVTAELVVTVASGGSVSVIPYFNGVADNAQAVIVNVSGPVTQVFTSPLITVVEGTAGSCEFYLQGIETVLGDSAGESIEVVSVNTTMGYV